jgi:hypothetical protein
MRPHAFLPSVLGVSLLTAAALLLLVIRMLLLPALLLPALTPKYHRRCWSATPGYCWISCRCVLHTGQGTKQALLQLPS